MKELILFNNENKKCIALIEDENLVEYYEENDKNKSIEGNIYVGKVQNIISGLQSAFIDIGERKNAFIHAKDILPKIDITKEKVENIPPISTLIKTGDPIIVEVKREAIDKKGPRLSTHINLPSRFIVLLPNAPFVTVSSKIEDEEKRIKLKGLVKNNLPPNLGAIVRTSAQNVSDNEIIEDIKFIINKWNDICNNKINNYPQKIYDTGGIIKKIIIDLIDNNLDKFVVNNKENKDFIESILKDFNILKEIEINNEAQNLYNIQKELSKLQNNKIYLKSGAFITIDKTEALHAIDVNSGKFIGKKDMESTILKVNIEAAKEISKQLRLRDISGIVVIDFIDMHIEENKIKVINTIKEEAKKDRSKVQIEEFTKLNLMELTRKHINSKK